MDLVCHSKAGFLFPRFEISAFRAFRKLALHEPLTARSPKYPPHLHKISRAVHSEQVLSAALPTLLFALPALLTCRKYALRMFPRFRSQHRSHFSSNSTYHPDTAPEAMFPHVFIITRGKLL